MESPLSKVICVAAINPPTPMPAEALAEAGDALRTTLYTRRGMEQNLSIKP